LFFLLLWLMGEASSAARRVVGWDSNPNKYFPLNTGHPRQKKLVVSAP